MMKLNFTVREREILTRIGVDFDVDSELSDEQLEDMYEMVTDVLGTGSFGYADDAYGTPDPDASTAEQIVDKLIPLMRARGLFG